MAAWGNQGVRGVKMWKHDRSLADEPARQPKWALNELMERIDGDREFLRELLVIFRQDLRVNLQKSHEAIGNSDYEQISRAAHTMKGMLRNLSMAVAGETAAALETASRESRGSGSKRILEGLDEGGGENRPAV